MFPQSNVSGLKNGRILVASRPQLPYMFCVLVLVWFQVSQEWWVGHLKNDVHALLLLYCKPRRSRKVIEELDNKNKEWKYYLIIPPAVLLRLSGNQQDILYQGLVHCLPRTFARTFLTKVLVVLHGSQNIHRLQGKRSHWIALNLFLFSPALCSDSIYLYLTL